jgi:hypothetical protein
VLTITVPGKETFDEATSEFQTYGSITLRLEHSLVSLSKWESKYKKPFLGDGEKTDEEVLGYVEAMILDDDFPPGVSSRLSEENMAIVNEYINDSMTATWFATESSGRSSEQITSELIYYWLSSFNIPFECQYWHLNRLFTLIRVHTVKNSKPKKQTRAEMAAQRRRINAERRAKLGSSG